MSDQQVEQDVTNGKVTAAEENGTNVQQQSGPSEDNGTTVPPRNGSDSKGVDDTGVVEQESEKQASSKPEGAQSTPEPQQEVESVTSRTSSPIDDGVGLRDVLRRLVAGSSATKVKSKSKLLPRIYQITPDLHYITWRPSKKPLPRSRIDIGAIHEVRVGRKGILSQLPEGSSEDDRCMTIVHGPKYAQLVLIMSNAEERTAWERSLRVLRKLSSECAANHYCL
jgi:hypothetical protein